MKLIVNKGINKEGKNTLVSYYFEAETAEEENELSIIRDYIFWGSSENGTFPKYAGRYDNKESGLVKGIKYQIPANVGRCLTGDLDTKNLCEREKTSIENLCEREIIEFKNFASKCNI